MKLVASSKCGATSTFIGTTRDTFEGKEVVSLEYEAYETMAQKSLLKVCKAVAVRITNINGDGHYHHYVPQAICPTIYKTCITLHVSL